MKELWDEPGELNEKHAFLDLIIQYRTNFTWTRVRNSKGVMRSGPLSGGENRTATNSSILPEKHNEVPHHDTHHTKQDVWESLCSKGAFEFVGRCMNRAASAFWALYRVHSIRASIISSDGKEYARNCKKGVELA